MAEIKALALDEALDLNQRNAALRTLVQYRVAGLKELCERLFHVRGLSVNAATGLAVFGDPLSVDLLLAEWPSLRSDERPSVMASLVSRPAWAEKLLAAVQNGSVPRRDLSPSHARQIRAFEQANLKTLLDTVGAEAQETKVEERAALLRQWKQRLNPKVLAAADKARGREVFSMLCAGCHKINGQGGTIGPDLTGSQRDNLDYLLDNILFPNADVPPEYRQAALSMKDGRVLTGVVSSRTSSSVILQSAGEVLNLEPASIAKTTLSKLSLMPEGLLNAVSESEARDLIAYLLAK